MEQPTQPTHKLLSWLPNLNREIWILAAGQLLLFIGQGFTLVYASIFFVNQLGFSPTQVGLALASSGLSGMVGRFFAGNAIDSRLGRRGTLLLAAVISALACFSLAFAETFFLLIVGNLLLGLGLSLYWPATLAVTADLTTSENRSEAFALTQLSNNLGLGLGALLAGQYIAMDGSYRALFITKGLIYLLFGGVIFGAIAETRQTHTTLVKLAKNWMRTLRDRQFVTFLMANVFFATFGAQLSSSLPLYLANFVPGGDAQIGFSEQLISYLFFWHALLKIVCQLPITRWAKRINHVSILLIVLILWAVGFLFFWITGVVSVNALAPALVGFSMVGLAEILYGPAASSLVGEMSPSDQRGIYFSLESECWAVGFLVGPALGGWALDHPATGGANLWLALVSSTGLAGAILLYLRQQMLTVGAAETQA
ncbi:MAG: MFS transporter [Leptolyngbyaceae cyanobacterium MO_188.B28]|nr:MFS transporter [Leptolyngbyaceae cyanobacterium MO_188.B28]